jgi:adenylate cyclase
MSSSRQLAAIMFTDIVGYTALMGKDEQKAFELLHKNREIHKPLIKQFHGTWVKELGDGVLASFTTVTDAVFCAAAIHQASSKTDGLQLRIGIHLGEVIFEDHDVFGDGVNIASRLQAMASPGSTWVSEAVYKNLINKKEITSEFIKEEVLKNVSEPVRIYEVKLRDPSLLQPDLKHKLKKGANAPPAAGNKVISGIIAFVLICALLAWFIFIKQKPGNPSPNSTATEKSIAVIPFVNISNDPQQEYFAIGMMDEILNHLYKVGGLVITSRTSSMAYKDSKKTSKEIAKELGVGNLLEGSVQKDGKHIRVIIQLINGKTDDHIWAETYDREFKDVFAIQSEIAQQVVAALKIKIDPTVKKRIDLPSTQNTEAYNLYLKATADANISFVERRTLLKAAITLDSAFADAYNQLALCWIYDSENLNSSEVIKNAGPPLNKALQLNPDLADAYSTSAKLNLWYKRDFKAVENDYHKMLQLNPSNTEIDWSLTNFLLAMGRFGEALNVSINTFSKDSISMTNRMVLALTYSYNNSPGEALRLIKPMIPYDKSITGYNSWYFYIRIHNYTGKYNEAVLGCKKYMAIFSELRRPWLLGNAAIAYYKTGQKDSTEKFLKELIARSKESPAGSPSYFIAAIYTEMGKNDEAIKWLEKVYADHEVEMYWLKVEPFFNSLHTDTRFKNILKKAGFD